MVQLLSETFAEQMNTKFEMSMFGEIKKFIGLQVHQTMKGIYVTQSNYLKKILKTQGDDKRIHNLLKLRDHFYVNILYPS